MCGHKCKYTLDNALVGVNGDNSVYIKRRPNQFIFDFFGVENWFFTIFQHSTFYHEKYSSELTVRKYIFLNFATGARCVDIVCNYTKDNALGGVNGDVNAEVKRRCSNVFFDIFGLENFFSRLSVLHTFPTTTTCIYSHVLNYPNVS